jgi:hypothetical protein
MRKHSLSGVLALAMLLAVAGLSTVSAGEKQTNLTSDGQCCVLENGQCVPCPEGIGSTISAKSARAVTITSTSPGLASACGSGPCTPMTPEQCAALGCDPGQCATGTSGAEQINSTLITSQAQLASGCGGGPCAPCPSGQSCATGASGTSSGCGSGAGYTLIGVRDANTGQMVVYRVPTATARMLLASSTQTSSDKGI